MAVRAVLPAQAAVHQSKEYKCTPSRLYHIFLPFKWTTAGHVPDPQGEFEPALPLEYFKNSSRNFKRSFTTQQPFRSGIIGSYQNCSALAPAEPVFGTVRLQSRDHPLHKRAPSGRSSSRRSKLADSHFSMCCISIQYHKKYSNEPHFPTPNHRI